jgi:hypothetical protein
MLIFQSSDACAGLKWSIQPDAYPASNWGAGQLKLI